MIERGQIYNFDFGPRSDRRQEDKRPVLIVQSDLLNSLPGYSLTTLVPLTTKPRNSPTRVKIDPNHENGLSETSFAMCEQIYLFPVDELQEYRGKVSAADMYRVVEALKITLAID